MKKKGVSLIVLSITILVMAILAAVAIVALEDSGIIGRSKNTVNKQNYIQEYERLQVIKNGILTDNMGEITVNDYVSELEARGVIDIDQKTTNDDGSITVKTKTGFELNIMQADENLSLSLGVSNATISLSETTLSGNIANGNVIKTVTATINNAKYGNIVWTTSNASVARVIGTETGAVITMVGKGNATITATYGSAKQTITVNVSKPDPTISLNKTAVSYVIKTGTTKTDNLIATVANTTNTVTWTSSNTSVATVSGTGNNAVVTIKGAGTAVITASVEGISKSCTYTVTADNTAPTFNLEASADIYLYVNITSIGATTIDYPLTINIYSKFDYESEDKYVLLKTATKTSGTSYSMDFSCDTYSSRNVKVEIIDAAGNKTTKTYFVYAYSCFVAGTQVLTESGMKNIEDIKLGEKVYTVNLDNNQKELKVINKLITNYTKELYELKIGNETILATPNHRFYIQDKGWIRAKDLELGDKIVAKGTSEDMTIHSKELKLYEESIPVYNLTVDGHHNYLITKYELLVHNAASPT